MFKIKYSILINNKCNTGFRFLFNLEIIQYLCLPHVFRLVVTIHRCKTAFCALWLYFSVLSHIGKYLSVFSKINLLMAHKVKKWIHLVKNIQPSGLQLTSIHSVEQVESFKHCFKITGGSSH